MSNERLITYREAINEAIEQEMDIDPNVFVYGVGVPDHKRMFGTTNNILEKFGTDRCFDTPLSEDTLAGFGLGASINGLRPIYIHARMDFLLLAYNQIVNMISSFRYNSGGKINVPIVIRGIIGRGWGQGSQHSKSMYSVFAHVPGIKVVLPTTPKDAKGLLIQSIRDNNPVLFVEHRWLYDQEGYVPEESFTVPFETNKLRDGSDLTIVSISWMNIEALKAAEILQKRNINIEILDPRCISKIDIEPIVDSVNKTRNCIIVDNDWLHCGLSAELSSQIYDRCMNVLDMPIKRIGFAPTPCPTARHLENEFFPNAINIIRSVEKILGLTKINLSDENFYSYENKFKGPF